MTHKATAGVSFFLFLLALVCSSPPAAAQSTPPRFEFGPEVTQIYLQTSVVGGIVTVAISHRYAVRYEMGDTIIFYGSRPLFVGGPLVPAVATHNLQFAAGFLFRF